jgi:predicted  nucleic acid-binding Zn-ribbon protein
MSEVKPVTVERAREALEDMDDYARMDAGVDAKGPRETLERFIAEHERALAELRAENERLRKSRNEWYHAAEGRRLANSDLRRRNAELQARVAELEALFRENARKAREQAAFEAAGAWDDAAAAIDQQLATLAAREGGAS